MTVFKQIALNGAVLKEIPFKREFELQGYLIAHPELLSLAERNDDFKVKELIGVERKLKQGRVDMVVEYESGKIAIVELKRGEVVMDDYDQLNGYLNDVSKVKEWKSLQDYKRQNEDFDELVSKRNMFGVLVGRSFAAKVMESLRMSAKHGSIINGLTIRRYRADDNEYLMTEMISNFRAKDYQKYLVEGYGPFGKGRMVLATIKAYVSKHRDVNYDSLTSEKLFPAKLRGTRGKWGCISLLDAAKSHAEQTGRKRHFLDEDDVITLKDGTRIVVSSQWGIGNIDEFIKRATDIGVKIERLKTVRSGKES